jgi:CobQ-like glutamine amidotransferase family enzyme
VSANRRGAPLAVAVVYPDLLGTYGDGGNGIVLARRAAWRGFEVDLIQADSGRPLPSADIYCIGGGEDGPQVRAATELHADGTLPRAVDRGAVVLGVCAGYQLLGRSFPDRDDRPHEGLGLLDVTTRKGTGRRAVGELMASPTEDAPRLPSGRTLPPLTGFENHGGVTTVGAGCRAVGRVERGVGNGGGDGTEGAWSSRVFGSYRTDRCSPATPPWPICCSGGRPHPRGPRGRGRRWWLWTTVRRRRCATSASPLRRPRPRRAWSDWCGVDPDRSVTAV